MKQLKDDTKDENTVKQDTQLKILTAKVEAYQAHIDKLEAKQSVPEKEQSLLEEISTLRSNLNTSIQECVVTLLLGSQVQTILHH